MNNNFTNNSENKITGPPKDNNKADSSQTDVNFSKSKKPSMFSNFEPLIKVIKSWDSKKKLFALSAVVLLMAGFAALAYVIGAPLIKFVSEPVAFRAWVQKGGIWSRLAFIAMMCLQVVVAFIPGEPLEISAGYAFGAVEGTVLCLIGSLIGSLIIFKLVKTLGAKILKLFFSDEEVEQVSFLKKSKNLPMLIFTIFLIPGTPKDLLSYFIGLTKIRTLHWLTISTVARIPSVITSTIGGSAIGGQNYTFAFWVFVLTGLASLIGLAVYNKIIVKNSTKAD